MQNVQQRCAVRDFALPGRLQPAGSLPGILALSTRRTATSSTRSATLRECILQIPRCVFAIACAPLVQSHFSSRRYSGWAGPSAAVTAAVMGSMVVISRHLRCIPRFQRPNRRGAALSTPGSGPPQKAQHPIRLAAGAGAGRRGPGGQTLAPGGSVHIMIILVELLHLELSGCPRHLSSSKEDLAGRSNCGKGSDVPRIAARRESLR